MKSYYDPTPNQLKAASIGRRLMDIAAQTPMKGLKDHEIGMYNRMATFGDTLTRFGEVFGPRNLKEVLDSSGVSLEEAQNFMKLGNR